MHGPDRSLADVERAAGLRTPSLFGGVWLISFADLISLLVSFFIMLYSMSDVQPAVWDALRQGLAQGLGQGGSPVPLTASPTRTPLGEAVGVNLDYLAVLLGERMAAEFADPAMTVVRRDDRIVIALPDGDLFMPRQMSVSAEAAARLARIAALLTHVRNRIEVLAFVADRGQGLDVQAWGLAIGRARAVAQSLRRPGQPSDAVAFATAGGPPGESEGASTGPDRIEIHVLGVTP